MARTSANSPDQEESISGYFRPILTANPDLLKSRNNEELYRRWLEDHPGESEVPDRVKQNLSNIKSLLRQQQKTRKHRKASKAEAQASAVAAAPAKVSRTAINGLETLEEHIDDCLDLAKNLDREGLETVIKLLRKARNEVVWKLVE